MALAGDPFRRNYGTLSDKQKGLMDDLKVEYEATWRFLDIIEKEFGKSRDLSVARTQLQTSAMWAVRAVTKTGDQE